jgi:hypothetical protein
MKHADSAILDYDTTRESRQIAQPIRNDVPRRSTTAVNAGRPPSPTPASGAIVGSITGWADPGIALVDWPGNATGVPIPARTTVELNSTQVGSQVVLVFEEGDPARPIVVGCLLPVARLESEHVADTQQPVEVRKDGQRLVLTAEQEIVLRCGRASVTLTRAGKILIRGAYLLSRSSGVNRIKGGSVQIN